MNISQLPESALANSVLVVAHPDDEILWFGSVVKKIDKIIICFLDDPNSPELGPARRRCLDKHPLQDKITCLGLAETGTFNLASWPNPVATEFGLMINGDPEAASTYDQRARELRDRLQPLLKHADNLFTHNPWGEYGHEEHVMVHRVSASIAEHSGTTVWHSNYVSAWSQVFMEKYITTPDSEYYQNDVDTATMQELAEHYKKHGVWTWMNNFRWFPQECFVRGPLAMSGSANGGWLFPLNFIRLAILQAPVKTNKRSLPTRLKKKLARTIKSVRAN